MRQMNEPFQDRREFTASSNSQPAMPYYVFQKEHELQQCGEPDHPAASGSHSKFLQHMSMPMSMPMAGSERTVLAASGPSACTGNVPEWQEQSLSGDPVSLGSQPPMYSATSSSHPRHPPPATSSSMSSTLDPGLGHAVPRGAAVFPPAEDDDSDSGLDIGLPKSLDHLLGAKRPDRESEEVDTFGFQFPDVLPSQDGRSSQPPKTPQGSMSMAELSIFKELKQDLGIEQGFNLSTPTQSTDLSFLTEMTRNTFLTNQEQGRHAGLPGWDDQATDDHGFLNLEHLHAPSFSQAELGFGTPSNSMDLRMFRESFPGLPRPPQEGSSQSFNPTGES